MRNNAPTFGDFRCRHCRNPVSAMSMLSGVNNRNHCPYCLWSCHLDLFAAGDRLSACKGQMKPIGLTMKKSRNKYRLESRGELMLIHECIECNTLSINRIAADDDPESIMAVFHGSLLDNCQLQGLCQKQGIALLGADQNGLVYTQLYGHNTKMFA